MKDTSNCKHRNKEEDIMTCAKCMAEHTITGDYPRYEPDEEEFRGKLTEGRQ